MNTRTSQRSNERPAHAAIIYKIVCGNPGCKFEFPLTVNRANIVVLRSDLPVRLCRPPRDIPKRERRLGTGTFSSRPSSTNAADGHDIA